MPIFVFSGHTLDLGKGRLWNSHGDVMLRPKSLTLLTYLVRNPGRVISKDELIEAVWPDVMVSDESLRGRGADPHRPAPRHHPR
jgi:DNA-binding winged helix-turn-helix (wHTH) protein